MILFLSFEIILYLEHYLYNKEMVERERELEERERDIWLPGMAKCIKTRPSSLIRPRTRSYERGRDRAKEDWLATWMREGDERRRRRRSDETSTTLPPRSGDGGSWTKGAAHPALRVGSGGVTAGRRQAARRARRLRRRSSRPRWGGVERESRVWVGPLDPRVRVNPIHGPRPNFMVRKGAH